MLETGNGKYAVVDTESSTMETLAVKCGTTYFIYVLNNGDARTGTPIKFVADGASSYQVKIFNPSEGKFSGQSVIESVEGSIAFDPGNFNVHEDKVFILSPVTETSRKEKSE
jgi:hypothetical protein